MTEPVKTNQPMLPPEVLFERASISFMPALLSPDNMEGVRAVWAGHGEGQPDTEDTESVSLLVLVASRAVRQDLDALEAEAVERLRAVGTSWEAIAAGLGVTRQGAMARFKTVLAVRKAVREAA